MSGADKKIDLMNQAQGELTHFELDSCSGKKNGLLLGPIITFLGRLNH
jgi:hypothetical protein